MTGVPAALACALALVAAARACDDVTSPTADAEYGQEFVIAVGDTRRVGGDGLTLRLEGVPGDSRCPTDVTCIWAGEARVQLRAQAPAAAAQTLELIVLGNGGSAETDYSGRYHVRLARLEPATLSTRPIPANGYRAALTVTRR